MHVVHMQSLECTRDTDFARLISFKAWDSCFCASKGCCARWNSCNAIYELSSLESKISQIVSLSYVLVLKVLVGAILGGVIFRSPVHNAYLNTLNVFACTRESSVFVRNRRALGAVSGN